MLNFFDSVSCETIIAENDAYEQVLAMVRVLENNDLGEYNYYTAKKDGSYTALYRLAISADSAILNDVFNNKFYRLIKK